MVKVSNSTSLGELVPKGKRSRQLVISESEKDDHASEKLEVNVPEFIGDDDVVNEDSGKVIKCVPKRLKEIVDTLKSGHKNAVKEIGFGGLLHLKLMKFPKNILPWILDAFKPTSFIFQVTPSEKFLVSKDDVYDCFQLPRGPKELSLLATGRSSQSSQKDVVDLKTKWRSLFGVSKTADGIPFGLVCKRLKKLIDSNDAGDEFKQLFVLLSMGTFLAPTSNNKIDFKLLNAVEDVKLINKFDWCSYVFTQLVTACNERMGAKKAITGCLLILFIAYFHRFDFRGEEMPSTLPLIQHWDYEKMEERAKAEHTTGSLGSAPWSKVQYPISKNSSRHPALDQGTGVSIKQSAKRVSVTQSSVKRSSGKKYMQLELPAGVGDDKELESNAVDEVHLHYLKIKRLSEVFCSAYGVLTTDLKKLLDERASATSIIDSQGSVELTPTQAFFSDPGLHKYVDEVIKIVDYMKAASSNIPSFEQLSQIYTKGKQQDNMDTQDVDHVSSPQEDIFCNDTICSEGDDGGKSDFLVFNVTPVQDEQEQTVDNIIGKVLDDLVDGNEKNDEGDDVMGEDVVQEQIQVVEEEIRVVEDIMGEEVAEEQISVVEVEKELDNKEASRNEDSVEKEKEKRTEGGKESEGDKEMEHAVEKHKENNNPAGKDNEQNSNSNLNVHYIPTSTVSCHPYLLHSTKPHSCMVVVPENMGCSISCGEPNGDQLVISELIRDHLNLFAPVFSLRKDVIDYCFTFDHTYPAL